MSAQLDGELEIGNASIFVFGTLSGQLGVTEFQGEITPNPAFSY